MSSIKDKIISNFDNFSKNEKRIATFIIDNYDTISYYNGNEIAENADTSKATLVRFSQKIGYKGFIELKREINNEQLFSIKHNPYETFLPTPCTESIFSNLVNDINNFEKAISPNTIKKIVRYIANASAVYLIGFGSDSIAMKYLYNYLPICGIKCIYTDEQGVSLRERLITLSKHDLVIMSNFSDMEDDDYMVARYAKKVGAKFVSMTNSDIVGNSLNADAYVVTKESAETFYNSPILSILLCNIILSELRHTYKEKIEPELKKYSDAIDFMKNSQEHQ